VVGLRGYEPLITTSECNVIIDLYSVSIDIGYHDCCSCLVKDYFAFQSPGNMLGNILEY